MVIFDSKGIVVFTCDRFFYREVGPFGPRHFAVLDSQAQVGRQLQKHLTSSFRSSDNFRANCYNFAKFLDEEIATD